MRWSFVVVMLVACGRSLPAPPTITARRDDTYELASPMQLHTLRDATLHRLPPLPARRGIDLTEDRPCRAHVAHLEEREGRWELRTEDLARLARVASQTTGDCRIDVDAMFEALAPIRIGGCMGATTDEAMIAWRRVAIVASTKARRAAALLNVAKTSWYMAWNVPSTEAWIVAGDAYVAAMQASPDDGSLSEAAVDAYENALWVPVLTHRRIERAQLAMIVRALDAITDGRAADRARALHRRLGA